nr:MAG TPA: hypothetical protein [Caudoviricetes sp.]
MHPSVGKSLFIKSDDVRVIKPFRRKEKRKTKCISKRCRADESFERHEVCTVELTILKGCQTCLTLNLALDSYVNSRSQ